MSANEITKSAHAAADEAGADSGGSTRAGGATSGSGARKAKPGGGKKPPRGGSNASGKKVSRAAKKKARKVQQAIAHITSSFNNTRITITDLQGNVLAAKSAGANFKGSRKSTPFAAQVVADEVGKAVMQNNGVESLMIYVKGPGPGREGAIRVLGAMGLKILILRDVTPIPHNGPRPRKRRRV